MSQSLKKNSLITLFGQLLKTGFQGISFIILARTLGANDFGILISILAIGNIISPFVDFGSYDLIIKRLSNGEKFKRVVNETVILLLIATPLFMLLLTVIAVSLYGYSLFLIILVGLTVLFSDKLLSLFIAYNVARDKFKIVSIIEGLISALRLIFALLLFYVDGDVATWAILLFIHGAISTIAIFVILRRETQFTLEHKPTKKQIKDGLPFVWTQLGMNANQDVDKLFLVKMASAEIAGIYAVAMRVLNLALIPIYSFYMTAYPRYFRASSDGTHGVKHALSMLIPSSIIGIFTATFIYFIAPYAPLILGEEYNEAIGLIQLAALIPIIQTMATPFADTLSGYGKQKLRVYSLIAALILNIILNIMLIPTYGANGALIASISSQCMFFIACFGFTVWSAK